jgi:hypothetical protein
MEPLHSPVENVWLEDDGSRAAPNMKYLLEMLNYFNPKN